MMNELHALQVEDFQINKSCAAAQLRYYHENRACREYLTTAHRLLQAALKWYREEVKSHVHG